MQQETMIMRNKTQACRITRTPTVFLLLLLTTCAQSNLRGLSAEDNIRNSQQLFQHSPHFNINDIKKAQRILYAHATPSKQKTIKTKQKQTSAMKPYNIDNQIPIFL